MESHQRMSKNSSVRVLPIGVRPTKNGKFGAEIKHPFTKKTTWLGTFNTVDEASKSYKSKRLEFDELLMAKNAKEGQIYEKSQKKSSSSKSSNGIEKKNNLFTGEKQEQLMGGFEHSNSSSGVKETRELFGNESDEELFKGTWVKVSEDKEVKFSHKLGVPIVDNYGYLLGEFSVLDDLSFYV